MDYADIDFKENGFSIGVPITKVDTEKRIVEGFATLDNLDKAGDILDFNATKKAFASWPGNIREMHQKKAVGKAIEFIEKKMVHDGQDHNGMWIRARISKGAQDTWEKVIDGTLSGFSVGGAIYEFEKEMLKDADGSARPVRRVTRYGLNEISLVDSPCNTLAEVSLIKSNDGTLEIQDVIDDGDLEKQDQVQDEDQEYIVAVINALRAWRDSEVQDGDENDIIFSSQIIQQLKCRLRCGDSDYGEDENVPGMSEDMQNSIDKIINEFIEMKKTYGDTEYAIDTKEHVQAALKYINQDDNTAKFNPKDLADVKEKINKAAEKFNIEATQKDGEILQNNKISDISNVENLSDENKGLLRKFVDFLKGDSVESNDETEQIEKGSDIPDMKDEDVKTAISEAVTTVTEELNKSAGEKFDQVGDSLTKVAEALDKLATKDSLDELKEALEKGFDEKVAEVAGRIETLENSGALKKSGEDAGEVEELKKSNEVGFWADTIVPYFVKEQHKAGR